MKKIRCVLILTFLFACFVSGYKVTHGASTYYSTAKGWNFNDIVYVDACPRYGSASGGYSPGQLKAGYYRFVKSNGSYVALCEVNLETGTRARAAYKSTWDSKGGMWKWEQALYNQIDGTPEGKSPTATKTTYAPNGKKVSDQAQNYRFIKCWIKIGDLKQNPATIATYTQTVRYFFTNERTGEIYEDVSRKTVSKVQKGNTYAYNPLTLSGYTLTGIKLNGVTKSPAKLSYTVNGNNEICVYYRLNKMTINFYDNGGEGMMEPFVVYYGEKMRLPSCGFTFVGASFKGWATEPEGEVSVLPGGEMQNRTITGDTSIDLYAVWDYAPKVELKDLFFTSEELRRQENIEAYILGFHSVEDIEDGRIKAVEMVGEIAFEDDTEGWYLYLVKATDSVGNETIGEGRFYIVDTRARRESINRQSFRFISIAYLDTLKEDSVWRKADNSQALRAALEKECMEKWKMTEFGWKRQ